MFFERIPPCVYESFHRDDVPTIPIGGIYRTTVENRFFLTIWPGWTGKVLVFRVYIVFKQNEFNVL